MKIHRIKPLFLAAITAAILSPSTVQAGQEESASRGTVKRPNVSLVARNSIAGQTKRVWTNEDFPSREPVVPSSTSEEGSTLTENPGAEAKNAVGDGQEFQQVQKEVREEMLATARNRQKAYEDTIGIIEGRLQGETSEFRIQVYQRILEDTRNLQKINEQMIQRFEDRTGSGERTRSE